MSRTLTASDRSSLIRLASSLPAGSPERKTILAGLKKADDYEKSVSPKDEFVRNGVPLENLDPKTLAEEKRRTFGYVEKVEKERKAYENAQESILGILKKEGDSILGLKAAMQYLENASGFAITVEGMTRKWMN